jgi:hypothetical protein
MPDERLVVVVCWTGAAVVVCLFLPNMPPLFCWTGTVLAGTVSFLDPKRGMMIDVW